MLLNEILDTKTNIKWVYEGKYEAVASFDVKTPLNQKKYFVLFHAHGTSTDSWNVMFGDKNSETGELNLTNSTQDFESIAVFSAVKQVMHEFINKYQPETFTFTADDKRTNVYLRLFKRFLPRNKITKDNDVYTVHLKD